MAVATFYFSFSGEIPEVDEDSVSTLGDDVSMEVLLIENKMEEERSTGVKTRRMARGSPGYKKYKNKHLAASTVADVESCDAPSKPTNPLTVSLVSY